MILQGELLLRTKKKSELSWARGFFVLAVEDRTLFCFGPGGPGLERPRCVVRLSGARVSRVAADDAFAPSSSLKNSRAQWWMTCFMWDAMSTILAARSSLGPLTPVAASALNAIALSKTRTRSSTTAWNVA